MLSERKTRIQKGSIMIIYARDEASELYLQLDVSNAWVRKHDNGAMISCGLSAPEDISVKALKNLLARGKAERITKDEWNHSGCQSSCVMRGAKECRW